MARRVNLVPPSERVRTATNVGMLVLVSVGVLLAFVLGLSYYLLNSSRGDLEQQLTDLQAERARLEAEVQALAEYKALATQRSNLESVAQSVYAGRTLVARILDDLSLALPANVGLNSVSLSTVDPAGTATATGNFTMAGYTDSFPDVALLLVRLRLVEALQGISLQQAARSGQGGVEQTESTFSITGAIRNTQPADEPLPVSKVEVEGL